MFHKVLQTIQNHALCPQGSRLVVGFSGGADSTALLHLLCQCREENQWELVACHINHQLRGEESERDEQFCRAFCRQNAIRIVVFRENIAEMAKEQGVSVELCARTVRYRRFMELADRQTDRILTAHNATDQAETILFRLIRGTGSRGLCGIPIKRENIVRPLLFVSRKEIERYCQDNQLAYVTDSTNLSDDYTRNKIRHQILPVAEQINPSYLQAISRLSAQVQREEEFLQEELQRLQNSLRQEEGWNRQGVLCLHSAIQHRLAVFWLEQLQTEASTKKIDDVLEAIRMQKRLEVSQGKYLDARGDNIRLQVEPSLQDYFEKPLKIGNNHLFFGKNIQVDLWNIENYKNFANIVPEDLKNAIDYDRIIGTATIRQRKPGDSIQLSGFSSPRSFKKLFNKAKLSLEKRSRLAVICDSEGPVWLEEFGTRSDALPDQHSKQIFIITVLEEE